MSTTFAFFIQVPSNSGMRSVSKWTLTRRVIGKNLMPVMSRWRQGLDLRAAVMTMQYAMLDGV